MKISIKKNLLFVFLISGLGFEANAQYNNWAVGFQLVDPSGVNIRKYFGENKAFDVSIGTYGLFYGRSRSYRSGSYHNAGLMLRGTYLWHTTLLKSENLHGYYGFGGQLNSRRYYFPSRLVANEEEFVNQISVGGVGLGGLEYFIPNNRLSVFLEAGIYAEVIPALLYLHPEASVGVRMNF